MKKILVFSGSNSSESINQKLATYAASQIEGAEATLIDLRDYVLPIYSIDIEKNDGIPESAQQLKEVLDAHDGFVIAVPEHNSSVPAFFKNTIDWISRIHMSFFEHKPVALIGTSPGGGGARNALAHAEKVISGYMAAEVVGTYIFPKFFQNTTVKEDGSLSVNDEALDAGLKNILAELVTKADAQILT